MFLLLVNHRYINVKIISNEDKFLTFPRRKMITVEWTGLSKIKSFFFYITFYSGCMYRKFHDDHALNLFNFISYLYFTLLFMEHCIIPSKLPLSTRFYIFIFPNLWRVSCVHCMAHRNSYYLKTELWMRLLKMIVKMVKIYILRNTYENYIHTWSSRSRQKGRKKNMRSLVLFWIEFLSLYLSDKGKILAKYFIVISAG